MLQAGTRVKITDNAGGKEGVIFKVLGGSRRRYAGIGDLVVLSVKVAEPRKSIKKKDVVYGVVVRTTNAFRRKDGSYIRFSDNAGVVIDAIRCCKLALNKGIGGPLVGPASYFMKSPPIQYSDDEARQKTEAFIAGTGAEA